MSVFLGLLVAKPYILALIPVLAALRGSVMTSMASRVTSRLYLGLLPPRAGRILAEEAPRTVALALIASAYASLLIAAQSPGHALESIPAAVISAGLALLVLLPLTLLVVVAGFRRSLDPDNYVAPILTVLGDVSTVPSLVAASLLVERGRLEDALLATAALYSSLTLAFHVLLARPRDRRVIGENLASLILVGLIESGTGGLLSRYRGLLISIGLLHMAPSMMEDVGAALSVFASRLTTQTHLAGFSGAARSGPGILAEVLLGSAPSMVALAGIGTATAHIAYGGASYTYMLGAVALVWTGLLLALVPLVLLVVWLSTRLGLDPDNVVIPILTSIVDLSLIPFTILLVPRVLG